MQKRNKRREVKEHFIEPVFYQRPRNVVNLTPHPIFGISEGDTENVEEDFCGVPSKKQVDMALHGHAPCICLVSLIHDFSTASIKSTAS